LKKYNSIWKKLPILLFGFSLIFSFFVYGVLVGKLEIFPYKFIDSAASGFNYVNTIDVLPNYFTQITRTYESEVTVTNRAYKGMNLVSRINKNREMVVELIDMEGKTIHEWDIDWFDFWPKATHLKEDLIPKAKPGSLIHGIALQSNGNLVFNFDAKGLVCINKNSEEVWKLPFQTHHSMYIDDYDNIWTCSIIFHEDAVSTNRDSPYCEYTILKVTKDGELLREWSIPEILIQNELEGLLHFGYGPSGTAWYDDRLHLNDVETLSTKMQEGFFKHGDVMISLRNVNTIFVFDPSTDKIKFVSIGDNIRQHDPDFISGNEISVFDNNFQSPKLTDLQSKIKLIKPSTNTITTYFQGSDEIPFYTKDMGKHQWLPNGNLLITETREGRAFEIDENGKLVWQYVNLTDKEKNIVGIVTEVSRYPFGYGGF